MFLIKILLSSLEIGLPRTSLKKNWNSKMGSRSPPFTIKVKQKLKHHNSTLESKGSDPAQRASRKNPGQMGTVHESPFQVQISHRLHRPNNPECSTCKVRGQESAKKKPFQRATFAISIFVVLVQRSTQALRMNGISFHRSLYLRQESLKMKRTQRTVTTSWCVVSKDTRTRQSTSVKRAKMLFAWNASRTATRNTTTYTQKMLTLSTELCWRKMLTGLMAKQLEFRRNFTTRRTCLTT